MRLSIIIPVHNAGKYLERCLNLILNQGFSDYEIILVENNSTDDSKKIITKYARKHPKFIREYEQTAQAGAVPTRNFGIEKALGRYIWCIDADDEISPNALKRISEKIDENPDIITFGRIQEYPNGTKREFTAVEPEHDPDWKNRYIMYGFSPWQNVYKRDFWMKKMHPYPNLNDYRKINSDFVTKWLRDDYCIHEDMALMSTAVLYTENVVSIAKPLYYYRANPDSVLHRSGFNKHAFDIFPALAFLYKKFEDSGRLDEFHNALEYFFIWNLLLDAAKDFNVHPNGRSGYKEIRRMLKTYFPHWRKNPYFKKRSVRVRLRCLMNYYL